MGERPRPGSPEGCVAVAGVCRGCGSSEERTLFPLDGRFSVVECQRCGLASTRPVLTSQEVARFYPATYYGRRNRRFNLVFEKLIPWFRNRRAAAIESHIPRGRILDVGCGRGFLPAILQEHGWEAYGVELSPTAAEHATRELGIPTFVGDFLGSSFASDFFDVVVFWHVLEHLEDPVSALRKAWETLRPGGLLLVAVPNFDSLQARFSRQHWFHLDVPRHYHHFRLGVLLRLLEENGFTVADVRHFNLEQNPYGWIQSLLNRMGFRSNLLYDILKNRSAREIGHPFRRHRLQSLATLFALVPVVPISFALFLFEALIRRGGTIEVYARAKKPASA